MHHTKDKGDMALMEVMRDLVNKDYICFLPISDHSAVDLIAMKNNEKPIRIQVKYTSSGAVKGSTSWSDKNGSHKKYYDENDFDYFAIYLADIDKIVYPHISFADIEITRQLPNSPTPFYWWEDFINLTKHANKRTYKEFGYELTREFRNRGEPKYHLRKINRPSKEELNSLVWSKPTTQIAKDFNVSDKAIEKWVKFYGLTKPPRGYWQKLKYKNDLNQNEAPEEGFEPPA